jgi:molybdate transport system permease protein
MVVDPVSAVRLSLFVGTTATLLGLVPALALGWLLARRQFRGKAAVTTLLLLPLVLPPVATGLVLMRLLGRGTVVGGFLASVGLPITFSIAGAVLAALVVGFPLYVLSIRGAFEAVDARFEEVSLTLGSRPIETWRRVTLPLALPGIGAGMVLAFARGLGEFGATVVLAGNMEGKTRTVALAVYALLDAPGSDREVTVLLIASVTLALLGLAGFEALARYQRRRLDLDA